jgi:hypothetical protein
MANPGESFDEDVQNATFDYRKVFGGYSMAF